MRRSIFLVFFIAGFLSCAPGQTTAQLPSEAKTSGASGGDRTVYVTKSGGKYHLQDCSSLRGSSIPVNLQEAALSGYEPCSRCAPPVLSPADIAATGAYYAAALYRVNVEEPGRCEAVDFSRLVRAEVIEHIDGDTIRVRITNPPKDLGVVETIRLIGVDTPETVHPKKEVEVFGKEASDWTKSRLLHKTVYLAFDWDLRDRYGRLLAYVYTNDKICHNAELIRQGYGHAYTRFNFRFLEEFRGYEHDARNARRGLWNSA